MPDADETESGPEPEPRSDSELRPPRSLWLLSESRRSWLAVAAAVPVALGAMALLRLGSGDLAELIGADRTASAILSYVTTWALFATFHTVLMWLAYRGLRGAEFWRALEADPSWRRYQARAPLVRVLMGLGAVSWSVSISALALLVVAAMMLQPALRTVPIALMLALAMVAASWLNVAVSYAVHHARVDHRHTIFRFPGEPPERFVDYVYLSVGFQATFGATDVQVCNSRGRRQVMAQAVLAFGFNTVIIGMVIALLVGAS